MAATVILRIAGAPQSVAFGERTADALRWATAASASAAVALAAGGPNYASIAAGNTATTAGQTFAVDNGDGTISVYSHGAATTADALRTIIKDPAASTALALLGAANGRTGQGELDTRRNLLDLTNSVDLVDFGSGAFPSPSLTVLGRTVHERVNGTAGTLVRGFDGDGFYENTSPAGRGGAYVVGLASVPAVYLRVTGKIASGGTTSPVDQAGIGLMFWTDDITPDPYVVPDTAAHVTFGSAVWSVATISGVSFDIYASGTYPTADTTLALDDEHVLEAFVADDILYLMADGAPVAAISQPLLGTMPSLFPGCEIFKTNSTDCEPKLRDFCFSSDIRVAQEARGRYLQNQVLGLFSGDASSAFSTVDDFIGGNLTSGSVGRLGWNYPASNTVVSAAQGLAGHPGVIKLSTATTTGTVYHFYLGGAANAPSISVLDLAGFSFVIGEDAASITDRDFRLGLTSDASSATPSNGLFIEHLHGDTNYFFVGRTGGSQTRKNTGIASGTTNWITWRVFAVSSVKFELYAKISGGDETLVATLDGNSGDNVPTANILLPYVQQVLTGTTLRTLKLDRFSLEMAETAR